MKSRVPKGSLWEWGLQALVVVCTPTAGLQPKPVTADRSAILRERTAWGYEGAVQSVKDIIRLACTRKAGGLQLPTELLSLPRSLIPDGCPIDSADRADVGTGYVATRRSHKTQASGPMAQEVSEATTHRRRSARVTRKRVQSKQGAREAHVTAAIEKSRRVYAVAGGHQLTTARGTFTPIDEFPIDMTLQVPWALHPSTDARRREQVLQHIATNVALHDFMLVRSVQARRREIAELLQQFGEPLTMLSEVERRMEEVCACVCACKCGYLRACVWRLACGGSRVACGVCREACGVWGVSERPVCM